MKRFATVLVTLMLAATAALARTEAPKKPADPARLVPADSTVETGADFNWTVTLTIENPAPTGLYLDSLFCEVSDLDPGETGEPRTSRIDLTGLVRIAPTLGSEGSNVFQHAGPASAENARLHYRMFVHRTGGKPFVLDAVVMATPGASNAYVSEFLESGGRKVEYVILPALGGSLAPPGLLMVHDHGSNARKMLRTARSLTRAATRSHSSACPATARRTGPADLMGPASVDATARVLDALRASGAADTARIGAWGMARGATVVAALAARRPGPRRGHPAVRHLRPARHVSRHEARRDSAKRSSPAPAPTAPRGAHGRRSRARARSRRPCWCCTANRTRASRSPRRKALVAALEARGAKVESRFLATGGHSLSPGEVMRVTTAFLGRALAR